MTSQHRDHQANRAAEPERRSPVAVVEPEAEERSALPATAMMWGPPAHGTARASRQAAVLGLQRCVGNSAVQRLLVGNGPSRIQRACPCGGMADEEGECESCRAQRTAIQRAQAAPAESPAADQATAAPDETGTPKKPAKKQRWFAPNNPDFATIWSRDDQRPGGSSARGPPAAAGDRTSPLAMSGPEQRTGSAPSAPLGGASGGRGASQEAGPSSEAGADRGLTLTPAIDTSTAEGLLGSLASVPVTLFAPTLGAAQAAAGAIQSRETATLASSLPEIEQPTGLPTGDAATAAMPETPALPPGKSTEPPAPGGSTPRMPVSTPSDSGHSTSAGPRPQVDLTGEADPAQTAQWQQATHQDVGAQGAAANAAAGTDFGESRILPTLATERLRPTLTAEAPAAPGPGAGLTPPPLPDDARAGFDASLAGWLGTRVGQESATYAGEQAAYQQASQQLQTDGTKQIAAESQKTTAEQEKLRGQARTDVAAERGRWQAENRAIQQGFETKAGAKRAEIDGQVRQKASAANREADQKLSDAEGKAQAEQAKAESEAAAKKREATDKPQGLLDRAKGAISSVADAIQGAVSGIFERLRATVKSIIDTAKAAATSVIDTARGAVVGLIKQFGEAVKGLVGVALAAFPQIAAKAKAWIDGKIKAATEAVNRIAERLKQRALAILDNLGKKLDEKLGRLHQRFNAVLKKLEAIAKAPFEMMEKLAKVWEMLKQFAPLPEGLEKIAAEYRALKATFLAHVPPGVVEAVNKVLAMVPPNPAALAAQGISGLLAMATGGGGGVPKLDPGAAGAVVLPKIPRLPRIPSLPSGGGGGAGPLNPGPGGGCGLCYPKPPAANAGRVAHELIQQQFVADNPLGLAEFPFSSPTDQDPEEGGNGRLDLAVATPTGLLIGEIKPATPTGLENGRSDIIFYEKALKASFAAKNPNMTIGPLLKPVVPTPFPTKSPGCPVQELVVLPPQPVGIPAKGAVYGYHCQPPFKELIRNPQCKCEKKEEEQEQEDPNFRPLPGDDRKRAGDKAKDKEKDKEEEKEDEDAPQGDPIPATKIIAIGLLALMAALTALALVCTFAPIPEPIHKAICITASLVGATACLALFVYVRSDNTPSTAVA